MAHGHRHFIPAAGHDWLLPLYDPLERLLGAGRVKSLLVEQAAIRPGHRVLDVGCGTGSVTLLAKRLHPEATVVGLDPDPKALARARAKAAQAGLDVALDEGFADALPYADASFDRAFSSLMFHHLDSGVKTAALAEVRRVLRPGGSLHLLDFGPPRSAWARFATWLIHRGQHLQENVAGRIPELMRAAGFDPAEELAHRGTPFGTVCLYRAQA